MVVSVIGVKDGDRVYVDGPAEIVFRKRRKRRNKRFKGRRWSRLQTVYQLEVEADEGTTVKRHTTFGTVSSR